VGNCFGSEITEIFRASRAGSDQAFDKLTPEVYREFQRAARPYTGNERDGHTLETTPLIHELYLRPPDLQGIDGQGRAHFFAICVRPMRRILIDMARRRRSHKRDYGSFTVSLDEAPDVSAVDDALDHLAKVDLRTSQDVELRFFGGLSFEETAKRWKASSGTGSRD